MNGNFANLGTRITYIDIYGPLSNLIKGYDEFGMLSKILYHL